MDITKYVKDIAERAKASTAKMAALTSVVKNKALATMAESLIKEKNKIIVHNKNKNILHGIQVKNILSCI